MKELQTIQKRNKLNTVYVIDEPHVINKGHHHYKINDDVDVIFQNGPRSEEGSISGILDVDLLEIVRHRLQSFQEGPYATKENEIALTKIEEALLWMNKRVEDRLSAGKLGTNKI